MLLSILGILAIPRFVVDLNPSYQLPRITITYQLLDSPPEVVEQEATAPLENSLSQISLIKKIYSISNEGQGTIELTFDRDADVEFKRFEVTSVIRHLYPKLHSNLSYPIIEQRGRESESKKAILIYRINANLLPYQIRNTVKDLFTARLAQLNGVKTVEVNGAQDLQLTIAYDYDKLRQYRISSTQIQKTIQDAFTTDYPGYTGTRSGQKLLVIAKQNLTSLEQMENLVIPIENNFIHLKDLADVYIEESKPQSYFRIDGLNSVSLVVHSDEGENRLKLAHQINQAARSISKKLPEDYQFQLQYDDTEFIAAELNKNYLRSGLAVAILIVFILMAYRSWKHLVILLIGLVVNVSITSLLAFSLAISIHLYTIAGITISFGMMIDNLIIMLDHLKRKKGIKVFRAIVGATLTTVLALLMVLLLPKEDRNNLSEFAIIVSLALFTSVLVATLFVPALYESLYKKKVKIERTGTTKRKGLTIFNYYFTLISFLARYRKTFIIMLVLSFGLPVFMLPSKWDGQIWYNQTIGSDFYQESLRPYIDPALGGALRPFVRNVYERGGYREPERTKLFVTAELPYGNTLEEMNRIIQSMERYLQSIEGIENFITTVQSGQVATIQITFNKKYERGALPYQLKNQLIARSLDWSGVGWNIYGVGQGFSNNTGDNLPAYRVEMRGYNYRELEHQADRLAVKLLAHARIQKVNTNERLSWSEKPSQHWVLDISKGSVNGNILAQSIAEKAGTALKGPLLSLNSEVYQVSIQSKDDHPQIYEVMHNYLRDENQVYKLAPAASMTLQKTASAIHKEDRQYIRILAFEYYGSYKFGNEFLTEKLEEMTKEMPAGYLAKKAYWDWNWQKIKRQYGILLVLMLSTYLLGAILFENLKQPFYVIMSIPLSFIGLFLIFSMGSFYFDQGGYAAFILLGGIALNASIFIINDLNNLPKANYNRTVAKAVAGKIKPILLTIFSTALGLTPFLIGGQNEIFWFSLAIGTIGGLLISILVFILVLPVMLWENRGDKS